MAKAGLDRPAQRRQVGSNNSVTYTNLPPNISDMRLDLGLIATRGAICMYMYIYICISNSERQVGGENSLMSLVGQNLPFKK